MIRDEVRKILENEIADFQAEKSVYSQLRSLEIVGLVDRLEKHFGIVIEPIEVDEETFSTVDSISGMIERKKKK